MRFCMFVSFSFLFLYSDASSVHSHKFPATSNEMVVLTTGASKQTEKYHTFDVAGNLWEWTDEASLYKEKSINEGNVQYRIMRGGTYLSPVVSVASNAYYPVSYRHGQFNCAYSALFIGFRVVLYIK